MVKVGKFVVWLFKMDPYDFYFLASIVMMIAGLLYMTAATYGFICYQYRRYAPQNSLPITEAWIIKNVAFLVIFSLAIVLGRSSIGRASSLLILVDTVIAYTYYPRHMIPEKRILLAQFYRQLFRNILLAVLMSFWNGKYLNDERLYAKDLFRMICGLCLFLGGMYMKMNSFYEERFVGVTSNDRLQGGMFDIVSSPESLGVFIQWCGFHMVAMDYVGLGFTTYKCCVAIGNALLRHQWYIANVPGYPRDRSAILPYLF